MNSRELAARPSLEYYKNRAKSLLKDVKNGQPQALHEILQRIRKDHPCLGRLATFELEAVKLRLTDVQFIVARDHGFESWPKFARHIMDVSRKESATARFESAADAVVSGDLIKLERMLREHPELVRERSGRLHHATLLNYVGANGVENFRQKTPVNAVKVAETLLVAGADVKAVADIYGGSDTLGLAATSIYPAKAGVQEELIDILIKFGADIGGIRLVNACLANGRGRAAEHLAKHGAPHDVEGAAGVGRLDLIRTFLEDGGSPMSKSKSVFGKCHRVNYNVKVVPG